MSPKFSPKFVDKMYKAWKIQQSQVVLVSDNQGNLRVHTMKRDAVYSGMQLVRPNMTMLFRPPASIASPYSFSVDERAQNYTVQELFDSGFLTIETGVYEWPFIVVPKEMPIVICGPRKSFKDKDGELCRILGC